MILRNCGIAVIVLLGSIASALADQAECEKTVRALLYPYGKNKPETVLNRFGTVTTIINGKEQKGFSLQTTDGSVYYDTNKNPTSLSFVTGETYWSPNQGKTWKLVNPNSKEVMDAVYAGLRSQAEKAENITCEYGIDFEGRTVNHYLGQLQDLQHGG